MYFSSIDDNICCLCLAKEELKNNRIQRRVYELLSKAASTKASYPILDNRELHFTFFRKPDKFLESDDRPGYVSGVHLEKTHLIGIKVSSVGKDFTFIRVVDDHCPKSNEDLQTAILIN